MKTTEEFFQHLEGFVRIRDKLNGVALDVLSDRLVEKYDSVDTEKEAPKQIIDDNAPLTKQLDELINLANEMKPVLDEFGKKLVREASNSALRHDTQMVHGSSEFYVYTDVPIKRRLRCETKVRNEYDGSVNRLLDVVRASLVVDSEKYLDSFFAYVFEAARKNDGITIVRFKNRFKNPTFSGYRDALFNLLLKSPISDRIMIVELQIHLAQILALKKESHVYYEFFRDFFAGNMDAVEERMLLLEKIGRQFVQGDHPGDFKIGLSKVIEEASIEQLSGLDQLLGNDGVQDYFLAAVVARRKLYLIENNSPEDKGAILDAKMQLAYNIYYSACELSYFSERIALGFELFQEVKVARENMYGPNHPSTIEPEIQMLEARVIGLYDEDEKLEEDLRRIFALSLKVLEKHDINRIHAAFVLGLHLRLKENWKEKGEGEKYLRLAYNWSEEALIFDTEYPYELARLLIDYDVKEALKLIRKCFMREIETTGKSYYWGLISSVYRKALKIAIREDLSNNALQEELRYLNEHMAGMDCIDSDSDSDSNNENENDSNSHKEQKWWDEFSSPERTEAESLGYNRISWELEILKSL